VLLEVDDAALALDVGLDGVEEFVQVQRLTL